MPLFLRVSVAPSEPSLTRPLMHPVHKLEDPRALLAGVRLPALAIAALLLSGCFGGDDARASLVPYPRVGDVAIYDVTGALLDLARWENGIPFPGPAQVRLTVSEGPDVLDGARAVHPSFRVTTEVAEAGVFASRTERYVSPRQEAVIQSFHKLSQDQSILAFDERGYPWMFGASVLLGEDLVPDAAFPFLIPDNLGRAGDLTMTWRVVGEEEGATRLDLEAEGMRGSLWMLPGQAWPARVELAMESAVLAPHVNSDGGYPVTMSARLASLSLGAEPVSPRDRGATFATDESVARAPWDGEKPPDGDAILAYPLGEAVAQAKLLDKPLADWLAAHESPILYRGTYQLTAGAVDGSTAALWLLQWVDKGGEYYEVQISRTFPPPLPTPLPAQAPVGVPRVEKSAPAAAPEDANHGWFDRASVPEEIVPLSEGIRIVQEVFGATEVQIFLRSFTDPPGYSYYLDGGFEEGGPGRYTVVYNPSTGAIEQATGPVSPRLGG